MTEAMKHQSDEVTYTKLTLDAGTIGLVAEVLRLERDLKERNYEDATKMVLRALRSMGGRPVN